MKKKIHIFNLGTGNIESVRNAVDFLGYRPVIIENLNLKKIDHLILPGVGHFKVIMDNIKKKNIYKQLNNLIDNKNVKVLGICIGMQIFF